MAIVGRIRKGFVHIAFECPRCMHVSNFYGDGKVPDRLECSNCGGHMKAMDVKDEV